MHPETRATLPLGAPALGHLVGSLTAETRSTVRILVVEDERTLRETCCAYLKDHGYLVETCGHGEDALRLLRSRTFDVVLLDQYMTEVPGMVLLKACLEKNPDTLVVVMTGNPSVESSIEALRAGAWDYLTKPFSASHLEILVGRAAHTVLVSRETSGLGSAEPQHGGGREVVSVLGASPAIRAALDLARRVARTDASVFITGESGSGKEMIAQFIHQHSRRSSRPMVAVNCAALPESLLESEMFGHRKGAFTGAVRDKPGLLEVASGGTLFLDELSGMTKPIQAKLLRVIQDGVVRRVGSESVDAVVNVRFIAATNQDPDVATANGDLREDLYYRLCVVPLPLPPLRERPEDIPLLAEHFLRHYWNLHGGRRTPPPRLSPAAIRALQSQPWRGNVRELQNVMEHAVVLLEPGSEVEPNQIPFIGARGTAPPRSSPTTVAEESYHVGRERVISQFEQLYLTHLLRRSEGNMSRAARMAGVDRTTLYRLMEKHRMQKQSEMAGRD